MPMKIVMRLLAADALVAVALLLTTPGAWWGAALVACIAAGLALTALLATTPEFRSLVPARDVPATYYR